MLDIADIVCSTIRRLCWAVTIPKPWVFDRLRKNYRAPTSAFAYTPAVRSCVPHIACACSGLLLIMLTWCPSKQNGLRTIYVLGLSKNLTNKYRI